MTAGEQTTTDFDQFVYLAGHDLQEPLRKVLSFSELLIQDLGAALNDQARRDLQYITGAARRMQNMVQSLLALSRVGRVPLQSRPVCLQTCVERILEGQSAAIEAAGAEIHVAPLPTVDGDANLLAQAYRQLLDNALKFTSGPTPVIRFLAERTESEWLLGVQDNGLGIEPDKTEEIFAPFRRLHGWERYEGCGIGLTICRAIVARHGGRIWAESTPGAGSTFRFTLPQTAA